MGRRGFFEQVVHASVVAARNRERAERAAFRAHHAAVRRAEQAQRAEARVQAQLARSDAAGRKRLEQEAREARIEAREAEAEERTSALVECYSEIDSLLEATLRVDDYVELQSLRVVVKHPPFDREDLASPLLLPPEIPNPAEPIFLPPDPPRGLAKLFRGGKHKAEVEEARRGFDQAHARWKVAMDGLPRRRQAAQDAHVNAELERREALAGERARYAAECEARDADAAKRNKELEELIGNLGYGDPSAVQEYISIVLANSVYPDHFPVEHEFSFDPGTAELSLSVQVPAPHNVPTAKAYKYTKSTDEITATNLSQKICRDRYASAVCQVALRSMHEVFEADRRGIIKTVSLKVGTRTLDAATGHQAYVAFVAVAAERESFLKLNLAAIVPAQTLEHLGAAMSKDPYGLVGASIAGVRRS